MKKPGKVEQLMSQVVNDLNDDELTLFSLNNTPHLREASLRTFR